MLVNQYTASASEITAGALQDDGIGQLVGTKTFGKGVMQTLTPLPDGAAIKITTAHYLTPSKRDINLRGIDPDVTVTKIATRASATWTKTRSSARPSRCCRRRSRRRTRPRARGRLAQLGERLPYKEDVGGSSPSSPTINIRFF